nr:unnamed protein product [Callosobruchus analis]
MYCRYHSRTHLNKIWSRGTHLASKRISFIRMFLHRLLLSPVMQTPQHWSLTPSSKITIMLIFQGTWILPVSTQTFLGARQL